MESEDGYETESGDTSSASSFGGSDGGAGGAGGEDESGSVDTASSAGSETGPGSDQPIEDCVQDPDADGDGFLAVSCGGFDCDDDDPDIHPGAPEVCDSVDRDCDPLTFGDRDVDRDGEVSSICCNEQADGAQLCGSDCDDGVAGTELGTWAHCSACGSPCNSDQVCDLGRCLEARRVFVTSTTTDAAMSGYLGADLLCQAHADLAELDGEFKAFLTGPAPGLDRLEQPAVPFVRVDGVRVADNWNDLTDGVLANPIDRDEWGFTRPGLAWTGQYEVIGSIYNNHCDGWTTNWPGCSNASAPCGGGGAVPNTDALWDGYYIYDCSQQFRLYCLEQGGAG